jgi:hypothetical protein
MSSDDSDLGLQLAGLIIDALAWVPSGARATNYW